MDRPARRATRGKQVCYSEAAHDAAFRAALKPNTAARGAVCVAGREGMKDGKENAGSNARAARRDHGRSGDEGAGSEDDEDDGSDDFVQPQAPGQRQRAARSPEPVRRSSRSAAAVATARMAGGRDDSSEEDADSEMADEGGRAGDVDMEDDGDGSDADGDVRSSEEDEAPRRRAARPVARQRPVRACTRGGASKTLVDGSSDEGEDEEGDSDEEGGSGSDDPMDEGEEDEGNGTKPASHRRLRRGVVEEDDGDDDDSGAGEQEEGDSDFEILATSPEPHGCDDLEDEPMQDGAGGDGQAEVEKEELPQGQQDGPAAADAAAAGTAASWPATAYGRKLPAPVERILGFGPAADAPGATSAQRTFLVKFEGMSFRHLGYVKKDVLEAHKNLLLRAFFAKSCEEVQVQDEWKQVERVVASREVKRRSGPAAKQYLVKWRGLEYSGCTWEDADELSADMEAVRRFARFNKRPAGGSEARVSKAQGLAALKQKDFALPNFRSGRKLRDYQQVSVRWLANNYACQRNCILGDEMGLGKTAQSIASLESIRAVAGIRGPFLIVAPLTTLGHWQREVETWTDMNVVVYAGTAADRAVIQEHEWYYAQQQPGGKAGGRSSRGEVKFNVLLCSYDMLLKERHLLKSVPWAAACFDEAHRLKGLQSSTRQAVKALDVPWLLLLTGTPVQNNMAELYSILALLDPDEYPSQEDFFERFGGSASGPQPSVQQIQELQAALAPVLLRRMKEDVETLPEKEEVVIYCEMAAEQRAYYRALYAGQIAALLGGGTKNMPQVRNLAMELRKLCNHPVLCDGLEEDMVTRRLMLHEAAGLPAGGSAGALSPELEIMVRSSGKMLLLHKLLPKLRAEGKRVLIFSQFVIMLNVLEDYLRLSGWPVERIDGNVKSRDRQQAIDRFSNAEDGSAFVFLLSTRAGGQGITLTAADTAIIYDSDWNPQNDLQAMARCHRIGQTREVTIYRLVMRDTYEEQLFKTASRKYGLDEAILGFSAGTDPEADTARITQLLRHGAHSLAAQDEKSAVADEFAREDIDQILTGRTEKRQIGSRAGNTFSVATFAVDDKPRAGRPGQAAKQQQEETNREFWESLLPEAVAAHDEQARAGPALLGPRRRREVNYNERMAVDGKGRRRQGQQTDKEDADASSGSSSGSDAEGGEERVHKRQRGESAEAGAAAAVPVWSARQFKALEDALLALGPNRWTEVHARIERSARGSRTVEEVAAAGNVLLEFITVAAELDAQRAKPTPPVVAGADAATTAGAVAPAGAEQPQEDARLLAHLASAVQIPAVLQPVLGVEKKQRQLLRAAAGHKKHLELLASLYAIVADGGEQQHQPAAGASAAAAAAEPSVGGGTTATNGRSRLREFAVLSKRGCSLPGWWNLEDDVALADAALEFGYASGQQRRTLEQAFAAPGSRWHGIWRIKADPEPGAEAQQPLAAPSVQAEQLAAPADEVESAAAAAVKPASPPARPTAEQPEELDASAWRFLQQEVSRRLKCVVRAAVANYLNARCEQAVRASRRRAAVDAKPLQVIPAEGIQGRGQVTAVVDTAAEAQVAGSATVPSGNSVRGISPLQPAIRVQPADATQAAPRAPKLPSSDKGPKGMKQTTLPFARLNLVPTQAGRVVSPEMEPVFPTTAAVEGKVVEAIVLD